MVTCDERKLGLSGWLRISHLVDSIQRSDQLKHHTAGCVFRDAMLIADDQGQIRACSAERQSIQSSSLYWLDCERHGGDRRNR